MPQNSHSAQPPANVRCHREGLLTCLRGSARASSFRPHTRLLENVSMCLLISPATVQQQNLLQGGEDLVRSTMTGGAYPESAVLNTSRKRKQVLYVQSKKCKFVWPYVGTSDPSSTSSFGSFVVWPHCTANVTSSLFKEAQLTSSRFEIRSGTEVLDSECELCIEFLHRQRWHRW